MNAASIHLAWFETAYPTGPAIGTTETIAWSDFASIVCDNRRVGPKDTTCFSPTRFTLEPGTTCKVRRLGRNAIARSAIALDIEANKTTGEIPPAPTAIAQRLANMGNVAVVYTSHSHTPDMPRYRLVAPLSSEVDALLPTCEIWAAQLGLDGVIDRGKLGAAAVFYLPTAADEDALDQHEALSVGGLPIDAAWLATAATALQAERDAEQERIAAEAHAAAATRLLERIAAGFDPNDSLIEKIRSRLDIAANPGSPRLRPERRQMAPPQLVLRRLRCRYQDLRRHRTRLQPQRHRSSDKATCSPGAPSQPSMLSTWSAFSISAATATGR